MAGAQVYSSEHPSKKEPTWGEKATLTLGVGGVLEVLYCTLLLVVSIHAELR